MAFGDGDDTEDDRGRGEALQQRKIVSAMGVFQGNRHHRRAIHRFSQVEVGFLRCLGIVRVVQRVGITATHVHGSYHVFRAAMERPFQVLKAIVEGLGNLARKNGFVDLDVLATRLRQCLDFVVERRGNIGAQFGRVIVVGVRSRVGDGHGAGHGDLHRPVGEALGDLPVVGQEVVAGRYRPGNGRQMRAVSALAQGLFSETLEVDAVQVPTVIMDVVRSADFAVRGDVDAAGNLVTDDFLRATRQDRLRVVPHSGDRPGPLLGGALGIGTRGGAEPVGKLDVVRLGVGTNRSR